jgi:hypothetical protein
MDAGKVLENCEINLGRVCNPPAEAPITITSLSGSFIKGNFGFITGSLFCCSPK